MKIELITENAGQLFAPQVIDGITWETTRAGSPSTLKFSVVDDADLKISEGSPVRFKVNGEPVFYGFAFTLKRNKEDKIDITAYDQLRYLKNKDTYVFEGKTADAVVRKVATDFGLQVGTLEKGAYRIPSLVEDGAELFDIVQDALDEEVRNKGTVLVLFDDFGKLCLRNIANWHLDLLIDAGSAENYDYQSSIDSEVYNQIKVYRDNDDTGKREIYIAKDSNTINKWGVLQMYEQVKGKTSGQSKANSLLKLYDQPVKTLKVTNAFGDIRCRAGSMPIVHLTLDGKEFCTYMLVEKATHTFKADQHTMSLNLRGGEFS